MSGGHERTRRDGYADHDKGVSSSRISDAHDFEPDHHRALASGAFHGQPDIAGLVNETNFSSIYQQGENYSMFVTNVDEHSLLVVIFKSTPVSVW